MSNVPFDATPCSSFATEFAVAVTDGNVAHISFEVFHNYGMHYLLAQKVLVSQLIEKLLPNKLIKCEGIPSTARVTLTSKSEYDLLHVKVTYPEHRNFRAVIEEHNVLEQGAKISVLGEYKGACVLPKCVPLKTEFKDGYTTVTLPRIVGYDMIKLDK